MFSVTFTTDDGATAANLSTHDRIAGLTGRLERPREFPPAPRSAPAAAVCSISPITPTAVGSGSVTVNYSYINNAGTSKTGTAVVSYAASSNDNVVAAPSPAGQIAVVVGGARAVDVTFTTDDGQPATKLSITAGLSALPAGWSGPAVFSCASVSAGSGCQLSLMFKPAAAAGGALQLTYSYNANSGNAKTGSISIAYHATTHNNLVVTPSPSGSIGAVVNSGSVPVTLTFTTDDGNPATAITMSGLGTLPVGWSGPATFFCASVSTGTGCRLALTYAPTVNGSGSLALGYSYKDDSGSAKTGTASIAYASIPGFLYVTDISSNVIRCAVSGVDGSLSSCASAATGFNAPSATAFSGNWEYVTPGAAATDVDVCPVDPDGSLGTCNSAQTFSIPTALAVSGGRLYVADANGPDYVYDCAIDNADGSLSACNRNFIGATVNTLAGIAVTATNAYIVDYNGEQLSTCTVSPTDGSLSACTQTTLIGTDPAGGNTPHAYPRSAYVYGGNLYLGTFAGVLILPLPAMAR